jgi:hypothetical protein
MPEIKRFPIRCLLLLVPAAWMIFPPGHAVAAPAEVADVIHAAQPYGAARYGVLFITAYKAALWTDARHWSMQEPFALSLTYEMKFSTDEMVRRANQEMKHLDPGLSDQALKAYDQKLTHALPAVKPGDRITALHVPGAPTRFFWNGKTTATIDAPSMNADFFGIWLSPQSSAPSLRNSLLGGR